SLMVIQSCAQIPEPVNPAAADLRCRYQRLMLRCSAGEAIDKSMEAIAKLYDHQRIFSARERARWRGGMHSTSKVRTRLGRRAAYAVAALGLAAVALPGQGQADGITLKVFGGSSLDQLAPRQTPEDQASIQKQVFDGFIAE